MDNDILLSPRFPVFVNIFLPFWSFFISIVKIFLAFRLVWGYTTIVMGIIPVYTLVFAVFSLAIAGADIKTGAVPRVAFIAAFPVFCTLRALRGDLSGALAGAAIGLGVFALARLITGGRLGLADVWYAGLIGVVAGPLWWYPAILVACVGGIVWILITRQRSIPFIPCMALGGLAVCVVQGCYV
jgi:hypothetical protein